ncbi:MAG TPA: DISARM system phospholipase D-like protein DrmC [Streptosporangiaceae bacterium]
MSWTDFERAAARAVAGLGARRLEAVAGHIADGWPRDAILEADPDAAPLVEALTTVEAANAVAYLHGVAAGYAQRAAETSVQAVWSGPATHRVPVRATAQVLVGLVAEARHELLLMTYSAKPYPPLTAALTEARGRGVAITAVVETLQGAGSALAGAEPYSAFAAVPGIELWHWPAGGRAERTSKMHAKLAVADRRILLVTSANLTQSGVAKNIEAGLLVRGGTAPARAAEHVAELQANGTLVRLS